MDPDPSGVVDELRFVPDVRSADFERSRRPSERLVLYAREYADFDLRSCGAAARRINPWTAWTWAFRGARRVVELPEPLWLRALPFTFSVGLAFRVADLLRRRRTLIVTYAMENNAPERLFRPLPAPACRAVGAVLRWIGGIIYDRIAFASPAAAAAYRAARVLPGSVSTRDFLELAPRCPCAAGQREQGTVVFLGALAPRKGVPDLLSAWRLLPAQASGWTLRIAGTGPCEEQVRRAATRDPSIVPLGPADRETVHAVLRSAAVLVLPSRREGRWCEQIGLPIVEGLAHGCRIVTGPDTGLAPWLREHGHLVLSEDFSPREVANALSAAIGTASADSGLAEDLPEMDARVLAEDWMRAVDNSKPPMPTTPTGAADAARAQKEHS